MVIDAEDYCEIIDGVICKKKSEAPYHNVITNNLIYILDNHMEEKKCGGVFGSSIGMIFPDGNFLMPDLTVICDLSIVDPYSHIKGVPDLCVEVLSASTAKKDRAGAGSAHRQRCTQAPSPSRHHGSLQSLTAGAPVHHVSAARVRSPRCNRRSLCAAVFPSVR